jgi:hypothetical protein
MVFDGYHRWFAHKALGLVQIEAEVRQGNALDAVVASLGANAEHGKRRVEADFKRGARDERERGGPAVPHSAGWPAVPRERGAGTTPPRPGGGSRASR